MEHEYAQKSAKWIYGRQHLILCRHCMSLKNPRKEGSLNKMNNTDREQWYSGICSDKCWNELSDGEITLYKWVHPLNLHPECVETKVHFV